MMVRYPLFSFLIVVSNLFPFLGVSSASAEEDLPGNTLLEVPRMLPPDGRPGVTMVEDAAIHHVEWGKGPPVVLLHGGLGSIETWAGQIPELAASYRVLAIDTRGHGRSERGAGALTFERMTKDVLAVMEDRGIERASMIGTSDGGIVILRMALHHPERLERGLVMGTNFDPSGVLPTVMESPVVQSYFAQAAEIYHNTSPTPGGFAHLADELSTLWAAEPNFTASQLGTINVPITVVQAIEEEAIANDHARRLAELLGNAVYVALPDVGHFAMLQNPAGFTEVIQTFLSK